MSAAGVGSLVLYGHRGARLDEPENTLRSFRRALDVGATALELDVHLTRDGNVVVAHDSTGERMAGVARPIAACTLDEVRAWNVGALFRARDGSAPFASSPVRLPTFDETIAELDGAFLNVDLKPRSAELVRRAIQIVRARRAEDRVRLTSFYSRNVSAVRRAGYEGPIGLGRGQIVRLAFEPSSTLSAIRLPGRAAQLPTHSGIVRFARSRFIDKCHRLGVRVDFWTINEPEEAERLLALGADGIVTDDPEAIAPVFARRR